MSHLDEGLIVKAIINAINILYASNIFIQKFILADTAL